MPLEGFVIDIRRPPDLLVEIQTASFRALAFCLRALEVIRSVGRDKAGIRDARA